MEFIRENVQKVLASPIFNIFKVKYILYSHLLLTIFVLISGFSFSIVRPMTFYAVIFMGFIIWLLEAKDKERVILHCQVINAINFLADIYCLFKHTLPDRYMSNRVDYTHSIAVILLLIAHPVYALILYLASDKSRPPDCGPEVVTVEGKSNEWIVVDNEKNSRQSKSGSSGEVIGVHQKSIQ